ncbi:MAG TPA: WD40 repeat domain-containing protein [Aggregatilineales bacterium]|nr:WD40 repeat domain-containing protein [Anaerolineales bacterium]HRE48075.1 WD40 repeat domain-containing protein [Aggregatilineales bacterium]
MSFSQRRTIRWITFLIINMVLMLTWRGSQPVQGQGDSSSVLLQIRADQDVFVLILPASPTGIVSLAGLTFVTPQGDVALQAYIRPLNVSQLPANVCFRFETGLSQPPLPNRCTAGNTIPIPLPPSGAFWVANNAVLPTMEIRNSETGFSAICGNNLTCDITYELTPPPTVAPTDIPPSTAIPTAFPTESPTATAAPTETAPSLTPFKTLSGQTSESIDHILWSPSGKHLALASRKGLLTIMEAETGTVILTRRPLTSTETINGLAWRPGASEDVLVGVFNAPYILILNVTAAHEEMLDTTRIIFDMGSFAAVAWRPDGQGFATSGGDRGNIHLWEADGNSWKVVKEISTNQVTHLSWNPQSSALAGVLRLGPTRQQIVTWDVSQARPQAVPIGVATGDAIAAVSWSARNQIMWIGEANNAGNVYVANVGRGQEIIVVAENLPTARFAQFNATGTYLAVLRQETIHVYEMERMLLVGQLSLGAAARNLRSLSWDQTGTLLVGGAQDGATLFWRPPLTPTAQMVKTDIFQAHRSPISALAWDRTGEWLATASESEVALWSAAAVLHGSPLSFDAKVGALVWDRRGYLIVGLCGAIQIIDPATAVPLRTLTERGLGCVTALATHPTKPLLLVGDDSARRYLWDMQTGDLSFTRISTTHPVTGAAWGWDSYALTVARGAQITGATKLLVLDGSTNALLKADISFNLAPAYTGVTYVHDGQRSVVETYQDRVEIWSNRGEFLTFIDIRDTSLFSAITNLRIAASATEPCFVSTGDDGVLRLWQTDTKERLGTLPAERYSHLAWAAARKTFAAASAERIGTVELWDVAECAK